MATAAKVAGRWRECIQHRRKHLFISQQRPKRYESPAKMGLNQHRGMTCNAWNWQYLVWRSRFPLDRAADTQTFRLHSPAMPSIGILSMEFLLSRQPQHGIYLFISGHNSFSSVYALAGDLSERKFSNRCLLAASAWCVDCHRQSSTIVNEKWINSKWKSILAATNSARARTSNDEWTKHSVGRCRFRSFY